MSGYSFKTFNASTGAAVDIVPDYVSADISFEFSDVGALTLNYPKNGTRYSSLSLNRVEVGCFLDGVEMDDGRFLLQSATDDEVDDAKIVSFTGTSLLKMTEGALVYSADGSTTLGVNQSFAAVTAGQILRALFLQNSTRGGIMSVLTWASFSNSVDSAGNAWAFSLGTVTYEVGVNYLAVIRNLVDNGMIEVKMVGRDLRVYNAGGLGTDRTVITDPVVLRRGRDFLEAPITSTNEQVAAVALIQGDNSLLRENVNAGLVTAWGRIETFISQGGVNDSTTLGVLAAQEIARRSAIRSEKTRKINVHGTAYTPYTDYRVSDYVFSNTTGVNEKLRIRQMVISINEDGVQSASVVLNDKFLETEIAIARKVNGILGGASAGGSVAIPTVPTPPGVDLTIPSQVTGLSWTSAAYQNAVGVTESQITATWTAVSTNTNATVIDDLDFYEIQVKRNSTSDWGNIAIGRSDTTTAYLTVPANMTLDVRVRAVDRNANKGAWSTTSTNTSAADSTAPPVPKTPVIVPYLGQLRIFWDGLDSVGGTMPTDFWRVEVHLSTTSGFTPSTSTMVDSLLARGYSVQTDLTYGTVYYAKLIAVDYSGNKSAASAQGSATPETVTGLDIAALTVDTSNLANLAVTTAKIGLLQVLNGQIANLAVDDAKIGNVNVGKLTAGILAADITVSARIKTANTGARVELNSSGLQAFNASNVQTVDIAAASGNATVTGSFRTDFPTSTTPHLEIYNSGDRTTLFFMGNTGAGTQYAYINSPADASFIPTLGMNSGTFAQLGIQSRHRLWLNNNTGISLETVSVAAQQQLGYALYLKDFSADISRVSSALNITGGRLYMDDTTFWMKRIGGGVHNGGGIYGDTSALYLEAQASGVVGSQILMQDNSAIWIQGKFAADNAASGKSALYAGLWNVANFSGIGTVTYGPTMATTPRVLIGMNRAGPISGSPLGEYRVTTQSTTAFAVQTANSQNVNLSYWVYQLI
jgi:hypothetical protein